jgi:hypothetical protein
VPAPLGLLVVSLLRWFHHGGCGGVTPPLPVGELFVSSCTGMCSCIVSKELNYISRARHADVY